MGCGIFKQCLSHDQTLAANPAPCAAGTANIIQHSLKFCPKTETHSGQNLSIDFFFPQIKILSKSKLLWFKMRNNTFYWRLVSSMSLNDKIDTNSQNMQVTFQQLRSSKLLNFQALCFILVNTESDFSTLELSGDKQLALCFPGKESTVFSFIKRGLSFFASILVLELALILCKGLCSACVTLPEVFYVQNMQYQSIANTE